MIETPRLRLRPWRNGDREAFFATLNTPQVMEYLGHLGLREDHDALVDRQIQLQAERGHCFWVMEERAGGAFLGFCGISLEKNRPAPLFGEPELGWRLRHDRWGQGIAREAAEACIAWGRANLPGRTLHAKTVPQNVRSWGLMERVGMVRRPEYDFHHPAFSHDHPLSRHIVYVVDPA